MNDDAFEIVCNGCRTSVRSDLGVCPGCGDVLFKYDSSGTAAVVLPAPRRPAARPADPARARSGGAAAVPRLTADHYRLAAFRPGHTVAASFAGFWIRLVAYLVDGLIFTALTLLLRHQVGSSSTAQVLLIVPGWLYFALMESSHRRATIGKMMCGLAVTDVYGRKISFARACGRYFAKILSALLLCIGFLMIPFTKRKQGLHDLMAETLVVHR